jgi:hypothetical protein
MNLREHNLKIIEPLIETKYNDYGGYVAIDGSDKGDFHTLCEDHGISRKDYFLIGMTFTDFSLNSIGKRGTLPCTAIVLKTSEYGNTFDEISKKISSMNGKVTAHRILFEVNYSDIGKYIKRLDVGVVTKMSKHISEIEIIEK